MSLAAETREAARARPFLTAALRAGVVNYTAAAEWLVADAALEGEPEAVATALRRFAEDLPARSVEGRRASVSMHGGVGIEEDPDAAESGIAPVLRVGDAAVVEDGDHTAIVARGEVDAAALAAVLARLGTAEVPVAAASVAAEALTVVVGRRDGATAVRLVEEALERVPSE
ncbi:hypothetical protein GCM10027435_15910 [Haloparvum alkalitolerans]|uniref:DUF7523 family protein n=1 Tax=Haloparvum alkalitolerans TaxID=1042953 RepID=UPI003CF50158